MDRITEPVVTVAVIAYKASDYIIETLESVKAQTYHSIELVVSDDASPDDTVEKCRTWINKNRSRFTDVKLLTVEQNTGVAGNCSRALAASSGYYYKGMGCDDILFPDCIDNFVTYFSNDSSIKFSFAKEVRFTGSFQDQKYDYTKFPYRALCFRKSVTAEQQFKTLTKNFIGCAPTMFVETNLFKEIGIDEQYSTEDGPLFLRMTQAGVKLDFMDEYVIYRRVHSQSISHKKNKNALVKDLYSSDKKNWSDLQYEYASPFWRLCHRYSNWLYKQVILHGNNKQSIVCLFFDYLRRWINPFKWNMLWMMTKDWFLTKLGY